MPVLAVPHPVQELSLPPRKGRLAADAEVLVVGGGPAGLGAAYGAAVAGARTVLVERYGFLGGNATAALVMPLMSFHTQHPVAEEQGSVRLLPTDQGYGDPVVAGVVRHFLSRLFAAGGAIPPSAQTGYVVPFDPEIFKLVAMDLLDEEGVEFLFHSFASGILGEQRLEGVVLETKSGPLVMRGQVIIDCTGDADIAALAGVEYEIGRSEDGLVQPMTLMFRMTEFQQAAFAAYVQAHPQQWRGVHGLWDLVRKATEAGELELPREDILFFATGHPHEVSVNSTRVTRPQRMLGSDVWDLSYAEWQGRRQMRQIAAFLHKYVPGFEEAYVVQSGVNIGVRETRRIVGEYQLTAEDVLQARKFDDVIARCAYPIDVHNPKGSGTLFLRLPPGEAYDIPLRCLLPRGRDNLLVAGRCISGTHEAHSSYRIMAVCMAVGQAAGVCAALAARHRCSPRALAVKDIQQELVRQGADLRGLP